MRFVEFISVIVFFVTCYAIHVIFFLSNIYYTFSNNKYYLR